MAATCNVVPSNPSNRTARRRVLRNAHKDRLQKAMFMVDLQLQGMRSCIAGLFDRQTVVESNSWLTQPHVDYDAYAWNYPAWKFDPSCQTEQLLDCWTPICEVSAAVNSAVGSARGSTSPCEEPATALIPDADGAPIGSNAQSFKATAAVSSAVGSGPDFEMNYVSACNAAVSNMKDRRARQRSPKASQVVLPTSYKMKRYSFKGSVAAKTANDVPVAPKRGTRMRVMWPSKPELAADDVLQYFSTFGRINDMDWLGNSDDPSNETMKLLFDSPTSIPEALRKHRHAVPREIDGKLIEVRVCVKFSDNAVQHRKI